MHDSNKYSGGGRLRSAFLLFLVSLCLCGSTPARAALDPELEKPYELTVVLRVAEHRLLTDVFQGRLESELRDQLRAALGKLATVHVVRQHPLLADVEAKGLQQALDNYKVVSGAKVHFVLVDFVNNGYEIQARQHDGLTGLASPVVRQRRLTERLLVAREAALLVAHDFGLVGTIDESAEGQETLRIPLKGGGLGLPLGPSWVKTGDVFALAQITQTSRPEGAGLESSRVPWALLQVVQEPKDGICECRLYHRYQNVLSRRPGVLGYRCLKLGTIEAPLRLRLISNEKTGEPLSGCVVKVSAPGDPAKGQEKDYATLADGYVNTLQPYRHVAIVRVELNNRPLTGPIPIEIVDDQTVVCFVSVDPGAEKRGQLDLDKARWRRRLGDSVGIQDTLFRELNAVAQKSVPLALERAQKGLASLKTEIIQRTLELDNLKQAAASLGLGAELDVADGLKLLQELQAQNGELEKYIKNLDDNIQRENDPKRQAWRAMVERARLLMAQKEFGQALQLYEKVLEEGADNEELPALVAELRKAWEIKSPEHEQARKFIYETWPKLAKAADLKANLEEARKAFETCRAAGDTLSPQKFLKASEAHVGMLAKELEEVGPGNNEDARRAAETIEEVSKDLGKLIVDVTAFLPQAKPAPK
jgi:tetratricopeptide (TPR) repeat protein